jgi:hypothetical protein
MTPMKASRLGTSETREVSMGDVHSCERAMESIKMA